LKQSTEHEIPVSEDLLTFFNKTLATLNSHQHLLLGSFSGKDRKNVLDALGSAGSDFRMKIYADSFSGVKKGLSIDELLGFSSICQSYLEHTIRANKREDNLYHAYNLMSVENEEEVAIEYLSEMLEGQVAALSSGYLSSEEALHTLDSLRKSKLYRADQHSYLLYPNKELPGFLERNTIPKEDFERSTLFKSLLEKGNKKIVEQDVDGNYHFNGNFKNASDLSKALENLDPAQFELTESAKRETLQIFEKVFNHKAFTGRSGTFYGYEGLGSIYWHMVSKLQLAVWECCIRAKEEKASSEILDQLIHHYYEINEGIGVHKSPVEYGAFPTDPYSHTPAGKGAQQPGMTGQVKEDIICRFGELGVFIRHGKLFFDPFMLQKSEFLTKSQTLPFIDVNGEKNEILVGEKSLCFSFCQVPIVYQLDSKDVIEISYGNEFKTVAENILQLDEELSQKIFKRTGEIKQILVRVNEALFN